MKKRIIKKVAQKIADTIAFQFNASTDPRMHRMLLEQGAILNAYCIVFHDIYLN
jgi:hypothetical protein